MILSSTIKSRIISDNQFSLTLALKLDCRQETLIKAARDDKSQKLLLHYAAVEYYKDCGYSEEEIFESETV